MGLPAVQGILVREKFSDTESDIYLKYLHPENVAFCYGNLQFLFRGNGLPMSSL